MGGSASTSTPQDEAELRTVVAIGVTGAGKSSTCNMLSGKNAFPEGHGLESTTLETSYVDCVRYNVPLRVIDTMGFCHTDGSRKDIEKFGQFADVAPHGIDVFLFTEKFGRFTEANARHFKAFRELVGPEGLKNTIMLFTHVTNQKLQDIIKEDRVPWELRTIIDQVGGVVGVENKQAAKQSLSDLTSAVCALMEKTQGTRYSNAEIEVARKKRGALQHRIDAIPNPRTRRLLTELKQGLTSGAISYKKFEAMVSEAETSPDHKPASLGGSDCGGCMQGLFHSEAKTPQKLPEEAPEPKMMSTRSLAEAQAQPQASTEAPVREVEPSPEPAPEVAPEVAPEPEEKKDDTMTHAKSSATRKPEVSPEESLMAPSTTV
mmetsp:Transcript_24201/g.53696  ORF Transcript_24201/g.53696 Transcript_24201/m.53696 type:complete len:376 (-) Transcript_24201:71-1198(-)